MTTEPRKAAAWKTIVANLFLAGFSILFCALLAEVAIRFVKPKAKDTWVDRPAFFYVPKGAENLEGNSPAKEKQEGVYRLAVIGDSFTFAPFMQFDDGFPARLGRMLNMNSAAEDRPARHVEVLNYGVPGFSSNHEVPLVKQALDAQADLIILEITLNDPERKPYQPAGITIRTNQQGAIVVDSQALGSSWLARNSKLYSFLFGRVNVYKQGKSYEEYFRELYADPVAMSQFEGAIAQMKKFAEERKVPFVAVIFPLFGSKLDDSYPFRDIHARINAILDQLQVKHLDLQKFYRGIPAERLQVMPGEDFHPNEIGHRIASEAIYCWLFHEKIVPEEFRPQSLWRQRAQLKFAVIDPKNPSSALYNECVE